MSPEERVIGLQPTIHIDQRQTISHKLTAELSAFISLMFAPPCVIMLPGPVRKVMPAIMGPRTSCGAYTLPDLSGRAGYWCRPRRGRRQRKITKRKEYPHD
jgi:hypothetical protein